MSNISLALLIASAMLVAFTVRESFAADAPVITRLKVAGKFTAPNSEDDKKPRGISGMTCLGKPADASRECLIINDEERFGEIVTLTNEGVATTGKTIKFVEKGEAGKDVLGEAQDPNCKDKGVVAKPSKFDELDGEGVATVGDAIYVASSHSCTGGGKYKPSSFLLVRFKANNATSFKGESEPVLERSWRLADVLLGSEVKEVREAYGKPKGEGINIEGIAVTGGRLYAGLRTPTASTEAFIVSAPVEDLFATGHERLKAGIKTFRVELGANTGIRDLAALGNDRLLVLAGPTGNQAGVEYKLWLLDKPVDGAKKSLLATITTTTIGGDGEAGKAETVVVLEETPDRLKVLVLYDNLDEGEPTQYDIRLGPK
ncbi:DUF6929 family protein [Bradyrhizobium sp. JYMT SZCCT0428]|uniref:DUF6929 family protein n=1 Tax=Bradyrhizobium sp. JYMT SZCCT0428 TaxID=2807673 RepID=UPI001BAB1030|nr:DUF3616 domain-containing protein [Bradyrhizobium sp. JYMT SZCCT0428]MBR1154379.1 DUF3616 domain-containing protein [Bradyrhizobium sp. JYMT SZCCT0428]